MPAPQYVRRSYAGGAAISQLSQEIGSGDTTFTISPTTGWVEQDGSPLGTMGPFTVAIDLYTPSIEKILCSGVDLNTGVVTVYQSTGYSGRGYDGTTPQAHVPGASSTGVQPCWSAVEADEANQAVVFALGGGIAITTLTNNPAGRVHAVTSGGITASITSAIYSTVVSDFLKGGMTTSTHGLTVPVTGWYEVQACAIFTNGAGNAQPSINLERNSSTALTSGDSHLTVSGEIFTLQVHDIVALTAGDTVAPYATTTNVNATMGNVNNPFFNFLSASLVSA